VDGDKISWLTSLRVCCNRFPCVHRDNVDRARRVAAVRLAQRKRTPQEIEVLKREERAAKRRRGRARKKKAA
jgi:hypothetical protein